MQHRYILSIDQGTTSTRAILFNKKGENRFSSQWELECLFPKEGYVELDPIEIWKSVVGVINGVLISANRNFDQIDSVGITNQRETTIVWDKATGKPIYNAIVWQSRQSAEICNRYEKEKDFIHDKTGLLINPYFSASKIRYILENVPGAEERAKNGELLFGTVDTWILYRLTNGKVHATDITNASRTLLFNIFTKEWDQELLDLFKIPRCMLPEVKPSSYDYGTLDFFNRSDIHITGIAGDQHAALFGQACFNIGDFKNTYGTGLFLLVNTGKEPVISHNGLLTTVAWQIGDETIYALEGSVFVGGAAVQWLRDGLQIISKSSESETEALKVKDTGGVYLVPSFVGLGTPYWDDDVRGTILGITRATTKNHICRATLEAIAFQSKDVIEVMKRETDLSLDKISVDGGATANDLLMQIQSDISQATIVRPTCLETTALGVAYMAGLQSGFYTDMNEIKHNHKIGKTFTPKLSKAKAKKKYEGWQKAIATTRTFK